MNTIHSLKLEFGPGFRFSERIKYFINNFETKRTDFNNEDVWSKNNVPIIGKVLKNRMASFFLIDRYNYSFSSNSVFRLSEFTRMVLKQKI